MTHYDRLKRKRLGDVLVDEGLATEETVIAALQDQQRTGRLLSDIVLETRDVGEHDLARAIVDHYQIPYIELKGYTAHKELFQEIPAPLLNKGRVVPLDRYGKQMCFACQEVPGKEIVDELRRYAPGGIYFYVASAVEVRRVLEEHAGLTKPASAAHAKKGAAGAMAAATAQKGGAPAASAARKSSAAPVADDEDSAWKDLFDAANDSILTDIKGQDE
jgi:hypothetical protein